MTLFEEVGGQPFFDDLARSFYARVALDPVLRPLYPEDLEPAERHLALFLGQYWGGPTTYSDERGHPRLRMRHAPFVVDQAARDAWYDAMVASVADVALAPGLAQQLLDYFTVAADHMINA
jgi:hemoglobin